MTTPKAPTMKAENPIVGHKTMLDGSHVPLRADEAKQLWDAAMAEKARREREIPDEQTAIKVLFDAYLRLKEMGWNDPKYMTRTGECDIIELGSTGIHKGAYDGEWPTGSWSIYDGDLWPSNPALVRSILERKQS